MDYFPVTLYQKHIQFWPLIDNKLRQGEQKSILMSSRNGKMIEPQVTKKK